MVEWLLYILLVTLWLNFYRFFYRFALVFLWFFYGWIVFYSWWNHSWWFIFRCLIFTKQLKQQACQAINEYVYLDVLGLFVENSILCLKYLETTNCPKRSSVPYGFRYFSYIPAETSHRTIWGSHGNSPFPLRCLLNIVTYLQIINIWLYIYIYCNPSCISRKKLWKCWPLFWTIYVRSMVHQCTSQTLKLPEGSHICIEREIHLLETIVN